MDNSVQNSVDIFWKSLGNRDMLSQFFDKVPYLVGFFEPDGGAVYFNRAFAENLNVADVNEIIGSYNVLDDTYARQTLGMDGFLEKIFNGETAKLNNIKTPTGRIARYTRKGQISETTRQNLTGFPILDDDNNIAYVVLISHATVSFKGKSEIIRIQEYLTEHWYEAFDITKLEDIANLSGRHLSRVFKENTGETPFVYYKRLKITQLKETLQNPKLNVEQTFKSCGVDYNGSYARYFRQALAMSPVEYKKKNM